MKTIALLVAVAGLSLAACAKHDDGDNAASVNAEATINDETIGGDVSGNGDTLAGNAVLPAGEGANDAAPDAGNGSDAAGSAQ